MKIGLYNTLKICDEQPQGLYLTNDEGERILLPRRQVPEQWQVDDELEVFVYLDSDERPIATRQRPRVQLHQVAKLEVNDVNNIGAYLDWGLAKDLLLPFSEQKQRYVIGDQVIVYVCQDDFGRLLATTKLNRFIKDEVSNPWPDMPEIYNTGDQVRAIITQKTDLGFKAVVDHQYWGVIHHSQVRTAIRVGQTVNAFVRRLREDRRLDLALEPIGHTRTQQLATRILKQLQQGNGTLGLGDHSPADLIELQFGVSKRAFKMAIGHLLKAGEIIKNERGIELNTGQTKETDRGSSKSRKAKPAKTASQKTTRTNPYQTKPKNNTTEPSVKQSHSTDSETPSPAKKKSVYRNPKKTSGNTLRLRKSK